MCDRSHERDSTSPPLQQKIAQEFESTSIWSESSEGEITMSEGTSNATLRAESGIYSLKSRRGVKILMAVQAA